MSRWVSPEEIPCPATGLPLPYSGDPVPSWVSEGVRVRVKSTPSTRVRTPGSRGLRVYGQEPAGRDDAAWAGEIGTIRRRVRPHPTKQDVEDGGCWYGGKPYEAGKGGWWDYAVEFSRGRRTYPRGTSWTEDFLREKTAP